MHFDLCLFLFNIFFVLFSSLCTQIDGGGAGSGGLAFSGTDASGQDLHEKTAKTKAGTGGGPGGIDVGACTAQKKVKTSTSYTHVQIRLCLMCSCMD